MNEDDLFSWDFNDSESFNNLNENCYKSSLNFRINDEVIMIRPKWFSAKRWYFFNEILFGYEAISAPVKSLKNLIQLTMGAGDTWRKEKAHRLDCYIFAIIWDEIKKKIRVKSFSQC